MKKTDYNDEINIVDLVIIIWEKKWRITSFVVLVTVLMYFYQNIKNKEPIVYTVESEIRPLTYYDETRYDVFNFFLDQINPNTSNLKNNRITDKSKNEFMLPNKFVLSDIDKKYLYNLFVDKITQKSNLIEMIKEYNFIDREKYSNDQDYQDELLKLAYTIEVNNKGSDVFSASIKHQTLNVDKWKNFLNFAEKKINEDIQNDLLDIINDYLNYTNQIKKFLIEDIEQRLVLGAIGYEKNILNQRKKLIEENKYVERMQETLSKSIVSSDKFYAAKIVYVSSLNDDKSASTYQILLVTGLLSLVFGILVVIIANAIQNRR